MFRSNSRFVGLKKIFNVINVKSRRGFAVSVEGERSDGSVNQGVPSGSFGGQLSPAVFYTLVHES